MPMLITDDMVKKECAMSRPIPMKALGIMKPNRKVGFKPNYVKRGRSGIRYTEQPTYAPASVNSLVQSICNITKLETSEVEEYLENRINEQLNVRLRGSLPENVFDPYDIPEVPPDIEDAITQTRASAMTGEKPLRKGKDEEGVIMTADPSRFESAGATEGETGTGVGDIDVNDPRASRGGIVGRPKLRTRRADGEPEL